MPSFKVPCPSCEAKVLIKNPDLVGTKVECPKCKYRFKVEAPADEAAGDGGKTGKDVKAAAGEEPGKQPKTPKNNKKLIGVVLGVAAVVMLAIGGYAIFGGDSKKPSPGPGPRPGGVSAVGGPPGTDEDAGKNQQPGQPPPKQTPSLPLSDKEPTNLLPRETVAVYRFDLDRLRQTPLGGTLFDHTMYDLFRTSTGLDPANLERYFHCAVGEKERAPFGLIRLKDPVAERDVRMIGAGKGKAVNGKTLYPVAGNPFLMAVGQALSARSLFGDFYNRPLTMAAAGKEKPLGACVYDTQTILIGDYAVLETFLGGLKDGYPEVQTVLRKEAPPPVPEPAPAPPGGVGTPPGPMAGPPPAPPMTPAAPPPPKPPNPAAANKDYTTNPYYLSVSPDLKRMLNALEDEPGGQPLMVLAEKFDNAAYDRKGVKKGYESVVKAIDPVLTNAQYIGMNLTAFSPRQVAGTVRVVGKTLDEARQIALGHLSPDLTDGVPILSVLLLTPIELRNYVDPNATTPGGPETPGSPFFPGGSEVPFAPGGPIGPGRPGAPFTPGGPGSSGGPIRPPGPGGMGPGSMGMGPSGPPSFSGSSSGPPRPGSTPPSFPGSSSGPLRPPGAGGPPSGMPGYGPMPGPMGQRPPGSGPGPEGFGPGGDPKHPTEPAGPPSHIDLRLTDQVITVTVEINFSHDVYERILFPRLSGVVNQLKGKAGVFAGNNTWHGLAQAVSKYVEQNKRFPRGTVDRPASDQTRLNLPYPPVQRLSFFAELLPHLRGREGIAAALNRGVAWYDDSKTSKNAEAAGAWVPELLVSYYPQSAWRATSPLAPEHTFGGTNFVAIAGIGADAARYEPANPAHQKLVGISGYNWGSKVEEVTDGLANTIYLMQVPPGYPRPWAAGGGATVMGLNPQNPMADFKYTRPDGKAGTYAIMGDGAVRWIPADIDPKILLAMVTRAGGETIPNLDQVAPRVDQEGKASELKADAKPTDPAPPEVKAGTPPVGKAADGSAPPPKTSPMPPRANSDAPAKTDQAPPPKEKPAAPAKN
ncbi:MAG: hypothetical protein JWO38_5309 [Gemmataceae bacterium]|nr:hypothetical protein [Gemmataceae bacterium]